MQEAKVLAHCYSDEFEIELNDLLKKGWIIKSANSGCCGSYEDEFYHAILVRNIPAELNLNLTTPQAERLKEELIRLGNLNIGGNGIIDVPKIT